MRPAVSANSFTLLSTAPSTATEYVTVRLTGTIDTHELRAIPSSGRMSSALARRRTSVDLPYLAGLHFVHEPADAVAVQEQRRRAQARHRRAHAGLEVGERTEAHVGVGGCSSGGFDAQGERVLVETVHAALRVLHDHHLARAQRVLRD